MIVQLEHLNNYREFHSLIISSPDWTEMNSNIGIPLYNDFGWIWKEKAKNLTMRVNIVVNDAVKFENADGSFERAIYLDEWQNLSLAHTNVFLYRLN